MRLRPLLLLIPLTLWPLASTSCSRDRSPALVPEPPRPVEVVPDPLPCPLPPLPEPMTLGLVPVRDGAAFEASRAAVERLIVYLVELRAVAEQAVACVRGGA